MILPPVGTIHGVGTNDYWILVESWSKSYYLLQILFHSHGILSGYHTLSTNKTKPEKVNYNHCNYS